MNTNGRMYRRLVTAIDAAADDNARVAVVNRLIAYRNYVDGTVVVSDARKSMSALQFSQYLMGKEAPEAAYTNWKGED